MTTKIDTTMLEDVASKTPANNFASDEGKVVQLNASGQVPTNYLPETGLSLIDGRHLALEIADIKGVALNYGSGQADPFDSNTIYETSTNETYDATNDYYDNPGTVVTTPSASSYYLGELSATTFGSGSVTWGASDDNLRSNTWSATGDFIVQATVNDMGNNWSFGVFAVAEDATFNATDSTAKAGMSSMTNSWYVYQAGAGTHGVTINAYQGNVSDGTFTMSQAAVLTISRTGSTITVKKNGSVMHTFSSTSSAEVRFACGNANQKGDLASMTWTDIGTAPNMTLINTALVATTAPTTGLISVQARFIDSSTLNTDFTAEISRDNGTTWTAATLTAGAVNANFTMYSGTADLSSQPTGTSIKYRIKTLNNKNIQVSGVVLRWS